MKVLAACIVFVGFVSCPASAQDLRKLTLSIPQLTVAPTIDGNLTTREWTGACILPPLVEQPGSLVRNQHTRARDRLLNTLASVIDPGKQVGVHVDPADH